MGYRVDEYGNWYYEEDVCVSYHEERKSRSKMDPVSSCYVDLSQSRLHYRLGDGNSWARRQKGAE